MSSRTPPLMYRPTARLIALRENIFYSFRKGRIRDFNNKVKNYGILRELNKMQLRDFYFSAAYLLSVNLTLLGQE